MVTKTLLFIGLFCVGVLSLGNRSINSILAQELVSARVLSSEGQVEIRRSSDSQPQIQKIAYKVNDELRTGDTIITGRSGRLVLGLSDGSQAMIAPQTTVVIKDLSQSPRTLFNVIRGKTRIHIEKLGGQPNPYRVNTPTAVIAVRGTMFDVLVEEKETQVFLHEGEVAVTNLALPNQPVILSAGQMTKILIERLPNLPIPFKIGSNDGTFKAGRSEGLFQKIGRAVGGSNPDAGRGGPPSGGPAGGPAGNASPNGGAKPNADPGGPPPNGPKPNGAPKGPGKKL